MKITIDDVKRLHNETGVRMMDCKKALYASEGDHDKAIEWLKEHSGVSKLVYHPPIKDDSNTDAMVNVDTRPVTFKVDNLISKSIFGDELRTCKICGNAMMQDYICSYKSLSQKVYICKNKDCANYNKYMWRGDTNEHNSK